MKKIVLSLIAVLIFAAASSTLQAQAGADITGTYQGTISPLGGASRRLVLKFSRDDHAALKGVFYSIDQTGQPIPMDKATLQGSSLSLAISAIDWVYTGKVSPDFTTITGSRVQGDQSLPLNFVRATTDTAWTTPEPPARIPPMPADASPAFEVATIKPSDPAAKGKGFGVNGRHINTYHTTLADLIEFAYNVQDKQILSTLEWVRTEPFDISGQPDLQGTPSSSQLKLMVQKLLTERFKLTFHRDQKELSVFAVQIGKTGSKLTPSADQNSGLPSLFFRGQKNGGLLLPAKNASLSDFCDVMQSAILDRPVVDQTGLKGRFDFNLNFTPDDTMMAGLGGRIPPPADAADAPPSLFDAAEQQLGLKIVATKAPVQVLVLDHVEKPSAN